MNAEILAVGTELLMGQIANTNAQYITRRLQEAGINVFRHLAVGDNPDRLQAALNGCMKRSDIIIMTGGLGPTKDDLTKETVARLFGLRMIEDSESLEILKEKFEQRGIELTQNNLSQVKFPQGCTILKNNNGTAPGCIVSNNKNTVVLLPGPPSEMQPMFDEQVMPWLLKKAGKKIFSKYVKVFGVGESKCEDLLMDLIENQTNPTIATYLGKGDLILRVTANADTEEKAEEICSPILARIREALGDHVFSEENEELAEVVIKSLKDRGAKLAVAESCTGGMLAAELVSVSGASEVFEGGVVSYSNSVKENVLGVAANLIKTHGAVSAEVAIEMAKGAARVAGVDYALSTTGIAGPGGGTEEKPVGLVYVGLVTPKVTKVFRLQLHGNRQRIRNMAVMNALDLLRREI